MAEQVYEWTCSVCAFTWTIQATAIDVELTREEAGFLIGYPTCVNELYGLMNTTPCLLDAYRTFGIDAIESWVTFDQAYAICRAHTGVINPLGMYHFMAIRGVVGNKIWVANSAPGYAGVWDSLSRDQFNALGPVKIVALYK